MIPQRQKLAKINYRLYNAGIMSSWIEKIRQAIDERDMPQNPVQVGVVKTDIDLERQKRLMEARGKLNQLEVGNLLEKVNAEIWGGTGRIYETTDDSGWVGVQLGFRWSRENISTGYSSDGGAWVNTPRTIARGYSETYSSVVVDMVHSEVIIQEGTFSRLSYDGYAEIEFDAIMRKRREMSFDGGFSRQKKLPFIEATPELVGETLFQFGIDRIKSRMLPGDIR